MTKVYLLWKFYCSAGPWDYSLEDVYWNKQDAQDEADKLNSTREGRELPDIDDFGPMSGIEWTVTEKEVK